MSILEKSKSSKFKHVPKKEAGSSEKQSDSAVTAKIKEIKTNEPMTALVVFAVLAVVAVVLGIFVCKVSAVPVCLIIVIEALLAVCMNRAPLWLHLVVAAAEIALGIIEGRVLLLVIGAVVYFAAVFTISFIRQEA